MKKRNEVVTEDDHGNLVVETLDGDPMRREPSRKIVDCKICGAGTNEPCDAGLHS